MICSICKKREAVLHIQENSPGGVKTVSLCLECAAVKGFNIRNEDVGALFMKFVTNIFGTPADKTIDLSSLKLLGLKCPYCGKSLESAIEEHKVGCSYCFNEFSKIIDIMLFKYNNSLDYKGALPVEIDIRRKYKLQMLDLKRELRRNIKIENFKEAAVIRDKIKLLKETHYAGKVANEQS